MTQLTPFDLFVVKEILKMLKKHNVSIFLKNNEIQLNGHSAELRRFRACVDESKERIKAYLSGDFIEVDPPERCAQCGTVIAFRQHYWRVFRRGHGMQSIMGMLYICSNCVN